MQTNNRFLSSLSAKHRDFLVSRSTPVSLPLKMDLYRADEIPKYAYFITSGMASIVTSMEDGATAEVGIVGSEGLVGVLHAFRAVFRASSQRSSAERLPRV